MTQRAVDSSTQSKTGSGVLLAVLACGQFLMTLDSSVMNVSMATVTNDLDTTVTGIQSAITMYTLVMASLMITGGKVGAIIGRKRAFGIGQLSMGLARSRPQSHQILRCCCSVGRCLRGSAPHSSCRPLLRWWRRTFRPLSEPPPTA